MLLTRSPPITRKRKVMKNIKRKKGERKMKEFTTLLGSKTLRTFVKYNGAVGLAQELKPSGELKGIVQATDSENEKTTYYLVIENDDGVLAYATGVKREIDNMLEISKDFGGTPIQISCTMQASRKTGNKFFKVLVTNI